MWNKSMQGKLRHFFTDKFRNLWIFLHLETPFAVCYVYRWIAGLEQLDVLLTKQGAIPYKFFPRVKNYVLIAVEI